MYSFKLTTSVKSSSDDKDHKNWSWTIQLQVERHERWVFSYPPSHQKQVWHPNCFPLAGWSTPKQCLCERTYITLCTLICQSTFKGLSAGLIGSSQKTATSMLSVTLSVLVTDVKKGNMLAQWEWWKRHVHPVTGLPKIFLVPQQLLYMCSLWKKHFLPRNSQQKAEGTQINSHSVALLVRAIIGTGSIEFCFFSSENTKHKQVSRCPCPHVCCWLPCLCNVCAATVICAAASDFQSPGS
jgi:hypothetical protein